MRSMCMRRTRTPELDLCTITGAVAMLSGAALYFADQAHGNHGWHLFQLPALVVMGLGAAVSFAGKVDEDPPR
jgi:hypothetical protein